MNLQEGNFFEQEIDLSISFKNNGVDVTTRYANGHYAYFVNDQRINEFVFHNGRLLFYKTESQCVDFRAPAQDDMLRSSSFSRSW